MAMLSNIAVCDIHKENYEIPSLTYKSMTLDRLGGKELPDNLRKPYLTLIKYIEASQKCSQRDIRRSIIAVGIERGLTKRGEMKDGNPHERSH